jgi:hypothetical protein
MKQEDFLGGLGASIACIGVGITARFLGKEFTKDIPKSVVSYLKWWQIWTFGFGMLSLEKQGQGPEENFKVNDNTYKKGTTSPMVSTRNGLHF